MECSINKNLQYCSCTYTSCSRRGRCCECLHYHRLRGEVPACYFSEEAEKTYDRSINSFIRDYQNKKR